MGTEKGRAETDDLSQHCMPCLVVKDHAKRYVDSFAVPQKGVQHRYPVEALSKVAHSGHEGVSAEASAVLEHLGLACDHALPRCTDSTSKRMG